ncbi:hypothetical protein [Kribbella sp. NPDC004875]|uniref:hypothetical protein n=1 Tax=Kribbella sp. NPDC004875 TaxID=3364107 RepID=UPI003682DAE5
MTTPSEGPGWPQGSWSESGDWLRNLNETEQANLRTFVGMSPEQRTASLRFANLDERRQDNLIRISDKDPLKDRVNAAVQGAVARVHLTYDRTQARLSEMATSLATQGRAYRDAAVANARSARDTAVQGARDTRDAVVGVGRDALAAGRERATEFGQQVAATYQAGRDRATEFGQQVAGTYQAGREQVVDMAQRGQARLDQAWTAGADRANAAREQFVAGARSVRDSTLQGARNTRDTVVGAGRDAMAAGRNRVVQVGRWASAKLDQAMLKAESSLASANINRHNMALRGPEGTQVMTSKDRLEMSQRFSEAMSAPSLEEQNRIIQGMAQETQARVDAATAARMLGGVAPAAQAVAQSPAQPAEQGQQGQQPAADLTKRTDKGSGIDR